MKDTANGKKTSEEIEAINEKVDHELSQARVILLAQVVGRDKLILAYGLR